ncbi:hypothetical protein BO71DRAFT_414761 [Aspergillus ellipticus CBS 707.79]|uniref:Uncharacterized protein n=1 Tax=Aspergillus ellipticus CBS 707.79 TaxID=1448320 RepID=A0A319DHH8_9EURO|nr:hypothetical protein BO71DRAFT_414761 [Aspergillus ellipticus CBS 707.79]
MNTFSQAPVPTTLTPVSPAPIIITISVTGVCSYSVPCFQPTFEALQEFATLVPTYNLQELTDAILVHHDNIVGFLVTDAGFLLDAQWELRYFLVRLTQSPELTWSLVFGFHFPIQAMVVPDMFEQFLYNNWGLRWRLLVSTGTESNLRVNSAALPNMGHRRYRVTYQAPVVFIEKVHDRDCFLMDEYQPPRPRNAFDGTTGSNGRVSIDTQMMQFGVVRGSRRNDQKDDSCAPVEETDTLNFNLLTFNDGDKVDVDGDLDLDLVIDTWFGEQDVEYGFTEAEEKKEKEKKEKEEKEKEKEEGEEDDDDDDNASMFRIERSEEDINFVDRENCAVAIHLHRAVARHAGQTMRSRGYVGYVGHMAPSRSLASIILGMMGIAHPETRLT